jgi:ParB family transcriptional regulator, chromosome partitioning protein
MQEKLDYVSPRRIRENPENPRIAFQQEEMEALLLSMSQFGIQVPLTVYREGAGYRLIDGERRWRCAVKLNMSEVPVIVQDKPSEMENLVLMYNIHALREQWDYLTIASKLSRIESLLGKEMGRKASERELSQKTGLTIGQIRRCRLLMALPDKDRELLSIELDKPKAQQKFSEDFFVELQKSLKTIERRLPELSENIDEMRDVFIKKYEAGDIKAVTDFRLLARMSGAALENQRAKSRVVRAIRDVANRNNKIGIKKIYEERFQAIFDEKTFQKHAGWSADFLEEYLEQDKRRKLEDESIELVERLSDLTKRILAG